MKIQETCVAWLRMEHPKLAKLLISTTEPAINPYTNSKLMSKGMVPGTAQLILLYSNGMYPFLCIEIKRGETRDINRIEWQHEVEKVGGRYLVVKTFDGFREAVNQYLREGIKF